MSKAIEILSRIFDDKFIEKSHDAIEEHSENMCRLIQKSPSLPDEDILVCRLDQNQNPQVVDMFPYLRGDSVLRGLRGMKRICDFAIFVEKNNEVYVLLIEMKKGDESPQEQLNVTEPLIHFIFDRARILKHLDVEYKIRKIGITNKVEKRKTSDRGSTDYDDNNYVKLYNNKRLYLQRMLH